MTIQDVISSLLHPKPSPIMEAKIQILGRMSMEQLAEIYRKYIVKPASTSENQLDSSLLGMIQQTQTVPDRPKLVMLIAGGLPLDSIIRLAREMKVPLDGIVK